MEALCTKLLWVLKTAALADVTEVPYASGAVMEDLAA